jgi:hypothetical protein
MKMKPVCLLIVALSYAGELWGLNSANLLEVKKITGAVAQPVPRSSPAPVRTAPDRPAAVNSRPAPPAPVRPAPVRTAPDRPAAVNSRPAPSAPVRIVPGNAPQTPNRPLPKNSPVVNQTANRNIVSLPIVNSIVKAGIKEPIDQKVVLKDIRKKNSWPDAIQPLFKLQKQYGVKPDRFDSLSSDPRSGFKRKASFIAAKRYGKGHGFFLDIMELENDELLDAGFSGNQVQVAETALNGQDPTQIAGLMVSASISAAQDYYSAVAIPIPDGIKQELSLSFPLGEALVNIVRYAVGNVEIALPTTYGKIGKREYLGDDFAVVVGDIIVFKQDPVASRYPVQLWGNELKHVADYESLKNTDPDEYAFIYMSESSSLPDTPSSPEGALADETAFALSEGEFYVVQCVFRWAPELVPYSVQYLITNDGNVVANDPTTHESMQIGTVSQPDSQSEGYVWKFTTPQNLVFEVLKHGELVEVIPTGTDQNGATVSNILRLVGHIKGVGASK